MGENARQGTREGKLSNPFRARCHPEMAFRTDDTGKRTIQKIVNFLWIKRMPCAINEGLDTIFLCFRHVIRKAIKLLGP